MNPATAAAARSTTIGRLRLRCDPLHAATLRTALELADWPQPDGDAIVLVRRIAVRGGAPQAVAAAAGARLATELRAAVAGEAASAPDANAVRFANPAALYAQLTRDLAAGRAARCWYWARWRRLLALPAAHAIPELWREQPLRLGAIAAELARSGDLARLWRALPPDESRRLMQALAAATGLPLPPADPRTDRDEDASPPSVPPPALLARWQPACRGLPAGDARVRLALFLLLLDWRPALVADATACRRLAQRLCGNDDPEGSAQRRSPPPEPQRQTHSPALPHPAAVAVSAPVTDPVKAPANHPASADGQAAPDSRTTAFAKDVFVTTPDSRSKPVSCERPAITAPETRPVSVPTHEPADRTSGACLPDPSPGITASHDAGRTKALRAPPASTAALPCSSVPANTGADDWIDTDRGGLPYLLNVLNHRRVQTLLGGLHGLDARGGGWHAWLVLGRALGLAPDDGVGRWLERRWQLHVGCDAAWQPQPDDPALVALAAALCGPQLWSPALIVGPGRLRAGPTHLDFERPLASVQLAVRRAGLDLDPGWLPWLGRVVAIRYVEGWP